MNQQNPDLSDEQKEVLFSKGTEYPGTGKFLNHSETGTYTCANCGHELFSSKDKYDSRQPGLIGWPSFSAEMNDSLDHKIDYSHGMIRDEITCANCGGHIGHVFDADDSTSGKHYCVNSVSLDFKPDRE